MSKNQLMKKSSFKRLLIASATLVLGSIAFNVNVTGHAMTQHQSALSSYNVKNYRTVNNKNYFRSQYSYEPTSAYSQNVFQSSPDTLSSVSGKSQTNVNFKTQYFLPVSYQKSGDFGNPQSAVIVGNYGYVMYTLTGGSTTGFVVKYNLAKFDSLGATKSGTMDILRHATWDQISGSLSAKDKSVLDAIQVGPTFDTGHGQSLAYNPKSHQMWFVLNPDIHAAVERLDMNSLKPTERINFELSPTVTMGENLAFDKNGNAYFYTYASGGWAPKNSVKIYRGKISTSGVHFSLVMQGLRYAPGTTSQSLGYNPVNNKLYLVSNGAITSLPISKLGHLSPSDVKTTNFDQHREFEALAFNKSGQGFLLVNRGPELMRLNGNL